jgi:hypothetical protein
MSLDHARISKTTTQRQTNTFAFEHEVIFAVPGVSCPEPIVKLTGSTISHHSMVVSWGS